jgi:glycosyltransferase involved in cell wall biosynthesis
MTGRGTARVASSFGRPIRYISKENGGKASALNLGIGQAEGDLFIVLDDDDVLPPWALARHAEALLRNSSGAQLRAGQYAVGMPYSEDYDMILRLARTNEGVFIDDFVLFQRKHESLRGPASERTQSIDPVDKWLKYDALLFKKIDAAWGLNNFHPFSTKAISSSDEALALLQKGVILFQRKAYDGSFNALARYRRHLDTRAPTRMERRIAVGLLGCRYGISDLLTRDPWATVCSGYACQQVADADTRCACDSGAMAGT